jgi:hypothetical protein
MKHRQSHWRDILESTVDIFSHVDGSQLVGLLNAQKEKSKVKYLFPNAHELRVDNDELVANPAESLALLIYAGIHPDTVSLNSAWGSQLGRPGAHASEIKKQQKLFFSGTSVVLPISTLIGAKYTSFEEWSGSNETEHLSPWLYCAVRSIWGFDVRASLEVEIPLFGERRAGRLDVVALIDEFLVCFEAKTSIVDAVRDMRFIEQLPKYKQQIAESVGLMGANSGLRPLTYLVLGGGEEDLMAENSVLIDSTIGAHFLDLCKRFDVRFVTANAVWQLVAQKILGRPEREILMDIEKVYSDPQLLGLTSAGYIDSTGKIVPTNRF